MNSININIAALGDISFQGRYADRPSEMIFEKISSHLESADIVIANLESPLTGNGEPIPNKCILRGTPGWGKVLYDSGIRIVTLANNHMMDLGPQGLFETIKTLEDAGIDYLGAGENIREAQKPIFIEIKGIRIALIARTSVIVSSPSYAEKDKPGVAFLEYLETCQCISNCKHKSDIVILMIHWGIEHYSYPSPNQRELARSFVNAGANLILGHHPHIIQGFEAIGNSMVFYSLGNFLFDDIPWSFFDRDGVKRNALIRLTDSHRKGMIIKIDISDGRNPHVTIIPTRISTSGRIVEESTKLRLYEIELINKRLTWPGYAIFWKPYSLFCEWQLRVRPQVLKILSWESLKKIRPHHFCQLISILKRSKNIITGKSSNPYD